MDGPAISLQRFPGTDGVIVAGYEETAVFYLANDKMSCAEIARIGLRSGERTLSVATSTNASGIFLLIAITQASNFTYTLTIVGLSAQIEVTSKDNRSMTGSATCMSGDNCRDIVVGCDTGDLLCTPIDGAVSNWTGRCVGGAGPCVRAIQRLQYSEQSLYAACGTNVCVFDRREGSQPTGVFSVPREAHSVTCLQTDPEDPWALAGGTADGRICVWDVRKGADPAVTHLAVHQGPVRAIAIARASPQGMGTVSGGAVWMTAGDDGSLQRAAVGAGHAAGAVGSIWMSTLQTVGPLSSLLLLQPARLQLTQPNTIAAIVAGESGTLESVLVHM